MDQLQILLLLQAQEQDHCTPLPAGKNEYILLLKI